jgi:hypothetical protein
MASASSALAYDSKSIQMQIQITSAPARVSWRAYTKAAVMIS